MSKKGINSRRKGSGGEREFAVWLKETLNLPYLPKRNLEQVREGGADIIDVPPFVFEVKRCESLNLRKWWIQVKSSTKDMQEVPIVAFRQNSQSWQFLISANYIDLDKGFIQLEEFEFKQWLICIYNLRITY